jgi:hypothetical protein
MDCGNVKWTDGSIQGPVADFSGSRTAPSGYTTRQLGDWTGNVFENIWA